uniref:Uncharacterized protein n=1 Tax=viral metagenome TaxID=1070528 RepID=A0A6C0CFT8_9ZZZZ
MEETWFKWFKFGAAIAGVVLIIYVVTMAFITAPN